MIQLVVKLFALAALLLVVRAAFIPFHKPEYERRLEAFEAGSYSTVFVGSSRTKCGVIPAYFDQLLPHESSSSYNFGVDTGAMPTTLDWSAKLIERNPTLKHIFIEIGGSEGVIPKDGDTSDLENGTAFLTRIDRTVLSIFRPVLPSDVPFFDHNRSLEQLGEPCRRDQRVSETEIQTAARRSRSIEKEFEIGVKTELPTEYQEQITSFLEYARSRGVSVHFFVPPLVPLEKEGESIAVIYSFLPSENKIVVNHDGPAYSRDTAADPWHLN